MIFRDFQLAHLSSLRRQSLWRLLAQEFAFLETGQMEEEKQPLRVRWRTQAWRILGADMV
ncbi:hypothetical protein C163_16260 [Pseudomonas sp. FGI182]|nr:hypothetical protein C163_16260 [Pseudomonas sp. FGI182]